MALLLSHCSYVWAGHAVQIFSLISSVQTLRRVKQHLTAYIQICKQSRAKHTNIKYLFRFNEMNLTANPNWRLSTQSHKTTWSRYMYYRYAKNPLQSFIYICTYVCLFQDFFSLMLRSILCFRLCFVFARPNWAIHPADIVLFIVALTPKKIFLSLPRVCYAPFCLKRYLHRMC